MGNKVGKDTGEGVEQAYQWDLSRVFDSVEGARKCWLLEASIWKGYLLFKDHCGYCMQN